MKTSSIILYILLGILIGITLTIVTEYTLYAWYGREYIEQKIKKTVVKKVLGAILPF
jgi:hypothetical protein